MSRTQTGVMRFTSDKNGTMFLQTTLKKRKVVKSPLETEAGAHVQDMNKEDIVNEIEPTTSSTLSKDQSTAMSKLVNNMVPMCFIYDMDFKKLSEKNCSAS